MEAILVDISKDSPVGIDLKYDDTFVEIEQEIDKDFSLNIEEDTNWKFVQDNCYTFLKIHSKDFKIAVWWVFANWHQNSWDGLYQSLGAFNQFIEKYHESFFPKSTRGQQNALVWLETMLTKEIVEQQKDIGKVQHSAELVTLFEQTQDFAKEFLKVQDNYFGKLIRGLKSIVPKVEVPVVPAVSEISEVSQEKKVEQVATSISSISSEEDAKKVFQNLKKTASMLSEYYRKENPFDNKALRITRFLSWIGVDGLPVEENGVTFINPPSEMTMMKLNELLENDEQEEAFRFLQNTLERSPYWLDGHYRAFEMLKKFNKKQEAQELKNALIAFVESNKGVDHLNFKDGTPFLSNTLVTDQESSTTVATKSTDNTEFSQKVRQIIQNHHTKEAIQLLQNEYETALSHEDKFKLRLEVVKTNMVKKQSNVVTAFLEGLERDVEKYHLDEWSPDLALEVYKLLIKHFDGQKDKKETYDKAYERVCQLDISYALN
ncbi:type VI secretion system protein TssA [Sulfurimonas sp.]|uniref:type VI secretion system protein TssA n=1 Tax=Sulfurimonas sp. TaxID=2022749 RepID=UPI003D14A62A